ncbi:MAG: hypothetical protein ACLVC5_09560 [Clostridia bacterium]
MVLTIDEVLQHYVENALANGMKRPKANGSCVFMDQDRRRAGHGYRRDLPNIRPNRTTRSEKDVDDMSGTGQVTYPECGETSSATPEPGYLQADRTSSAWKALPI